MSKSELSWSAWAGPLNPTMSLLSATRSSLTKRRSLFPNLAPFNRCCNSPVEDCVPELLVRRWHLRIFDDPVLLTSDAPVAMHSVQAEEGLAPALYTADAIYWPLGRRHLLSFEKPRYRAPGAGTDKVTHKAQIGRAAKVNLAVAAAASKWIFHHPDDLPAGFGDVVSFPPRPALTFEDVDVPGMGNLLRARRLAAPTN